jgi:Fe-S cluster assembly iron-binding protein IscA
LKSGGFFLQAAEILFLCPESIQKVAIPMVNVEASAIQAIRSFLAEKGFQRPLRIALQSSGCCDPFLGLSVDDIREADLTQEVDGLTFVITPATYELVGEVTISFLEEIGRKGFVLTSRKPVSEWDGFAVSTIRI